MVPQQLLDGALGEGWVVLELVQLFRMLEQRHHPLQSAAKVSMTSQASHSHKAPSPGTSPYQSDHAGYSGVAGDQKQERHLHELLAFQVART